MPMTSCQRSLEKFEDFFLVPFSGHLPEVVVRRVFYGVKLLCAACLIVQCYRILIIDQLVLRPVNEKHRNVNVLYRIKRGDVARLKTRHELRTDDDNVT